MADKSQRKKRLVYSPKAYVFIHSRKIAAASQEGMTEKQKLNQNPMASIVDVTNDVVGGIINRLIDQPSSATITLNNKNFKYTGRFDPMFLPMDGITIWLERIAGKPIQVFTGYIDEIPYYQMYPGTIQIRATCTLKRLMYTYFDPGTQAMADFFIKNGWTFDYTTGLAYNTEAVGAPVGGQPAASDSGFGSLLYNFMTDVCNWDPKAVVISNLPKTLPDSLAGVYQDKMGAGTQAYQDSVTLFRKLLSIHPNAAGGNAKDTASPGVVASQNTIKSIRKQAKALAGITVYEVFLAAVVMTKIDKDHSQLAKSDDIDYGVGIFSQPPPPVSSSAPIPVPVPDGPSYNRFGVGAIPSPTPAASPVLPAASSAGGAYTLVNVAVKAFYTKYLETVKSQGFDSKDPAEKIAITLSLGMGKEKYYAEILQACKDSTNVKIANSLANPSKADTVNSIGPDVLMASEAYQSSLPNSGTTDARVTWDGLMGVSGPPPSTDRGIPVARGADSESKSQWGDNLSDGTIYRVVAQIDDVHSTTSVYDDSLHEQIKIDLDKLKYYVIEYGRERPATEALKKDTTGYSLGGRKIGDLIRIINPKTGNSVIAMVADFKLAPTPYVAIKPGDTSHVGMPQIGLSSEVVKALSLSADDFKLNSGLGLTGSEKANTTGPFLPQILIETAGEYRFKEADLIHSTREVKPAVLNKPDALGIRTHAAQEKVFLTINEKDISIYNSSYKGKVSEVLADYFYIANDMGLRLGDPEFTANFGISTDKNFLAVTTDAQNANSVALEKYVSMMSQQVGVNTALYSDGKKMYSYDKAGARKNFPLPAAAVSGGVPSPQVVIRVDENAPRPIYYGQTVHLPVDVTPTADTNKVGITWQDLAKVGMASAFSSIFSFPVDAVESSLLTGDKALMNDIPVLKGVQQLAQGSMRQIMSLPNGQFCAFYPDYFGKYGRLPYWKINEIEIEELRKRRQGKGFIYLSISKG